MQSLFRPAERVDGGGGAGSTKWSSAKRKLSMHGGRKGLHPARVESAQNRSTCWADVVRLIAPGAVTCAGCYRDTTNFSVLRRKLLHSVDIGIRRVQRRKIQCVDSPV